MDCRSRRIGMSGSASAAECSSSAVWECRFVRATLEVLVRAEDSGWIGRVPASPAASNCCFARDTCVAASAMAVARTDRSGSTDVEDRLAGRRGFGGRRVRTANC